jgi:peptide/nickel transport system ATP-binding protein
MSAPLLAIEDLSVTVRTDEGHAQIIDRADLVLRPGSIHGVVGESGCGKSTLIKAVLGLLPRRSTIDRGRILFEGQNLLTLPRESMTREVRGRAIGFIPQDPFQALNPVFRVGDQMMELLRWHGLPGESPPSRGRIDRTTRARHRAHLISMLAAVQLADAEEALQILKLLRDLAETFGLSMVFVTHDFGVVAQLCDTVTVMYAGQTVESGPVASVLGTALHPYARMLLACHPDRAADLAGIPGAVPSPLAPPSGCRFHPRCPEARDACAAARPATREPAAHHSVACVLHDEPATATATR